MTLFEKAIPRKHTSNDFVAFFKVAVYNSEDEQNLSLVQTGGKFGHFRVDLWLDNVLEQTLTRKAHMHLIAIEWN